MSGKDLLKAIKTAAPQAKIAPDKCLPDYAVDGMTPKMAVSPATAEEVAAILAAAASHGAAVITWGGGTGMGIGAPPQRYDIALDITRLDQVVEHVAADLTVTVQAGIRLQELQDRLAEKGQYLPLDPPLPEKTTIGGILAANAGGPWRYAHGGPRDWLLGLKVALPNGNVVKSGGRVVKNVAGYDMSKLFVGSFGSLGVIVEAAFKVMPVPPARASAVASFKSCAAAARAGLALHSRNLSLESLELLNAKAAAAVLPSEIDLPRDGWLLLIAAAGNGTAVERTLKELAAICGGDGAMIARLSPEQADATWQRLRGFYLPAEKEESFLLRASLLPSQIASFAESTQSLAKEKGLSLQLAAWLGLGSVYVLLRSDGRPLNESDILAAMRNLTRGLGGYLVVEGCPAFAKRQLDVWGQAGPDTALMAKIKGQLDPRGTLSPGRFLGGL